MADQDAARAPRGSLLYHVCLVSLTAAVAGAIDGAVAARRLGLGVGGGLLAGLGAAGLFGVLLGVLQYLLVLGGSRALRRVRLRERWTGIAERPGFVVDVHAHVLAWFAACVAAAPVLFLAARASAAILVEAVRVTLLTAAGVVAVLFALLVRAIVTGPARKLFTRLDERFGLPRPRTPALRYALFVALPISALLLPALILFADSLRELLWVGVGTELVVLVVLLHLVVQAAAGVRALARLRYWVAAGLLGLVVGAGVFASRQASIGQIAQTGVVTGASVGVLRALTDVDRDGYSALFAGGDCAALDSSRSPGAREIGANGVDEDCDGADAGPGQSIELQTFYGSLPADKKRRFNVLMIIVDSLRADHLNVYGYKKPTSPFTSLIAKEMWVFERAFSQASATSLSIPSLQSGKSPGSIQWARGGHYPTPMAPFPTLPEVAKENGYATMITVSERMKARIPGVLIGFEKVLTAPSPADWHSGGHSVARAIVEMERSRQKKQPFFATLWFDEVHTPYKGGDNRALPPFDDNPKDMKKYDRGIAQVDHYLTILWAYLENNKMLDDTIVLITADHGEEFGEHGGTLHGTGCYVEQAHVPLLLRVPGFPPKRVSTPVALVDVVPTLLELLDLPKDKLELDGQSLLVPLLGPDALRPDRPIFCYIMQLFSGKGDFFVESVRSNGMHLHRDIISGKTLLFDEKTDPAEKIDLAGSAEQQETRTVLEGLLGGARTGNLLDVRR
jgi:arylsulfatase A-like enzyme